MDANLSAVIVAIAAAIPATLGYFKGRQVHKEVRTMNESTIGELSADRESRRIRDIPFAQRTPTEQRHIAEAPAKEKPQGPPE